MNYIPVIGLEIHAELLTNSKVYCSCKNTFGGNTNERICPVCSAMPGTLPSLNKAAVTLAVKAGLALDCKINNYSAFDRKNYFYPDLPKAYQITQFYHPICSDGFVEVGNNKIQIERIHIEEDAGKLIHNDISNNTFADFNRCGVPLIEIVTKPDFKSIDTVLEFVEEIALRLKYTDVCDARLEEGSLRVDVNISLMKEDSDTLGTRAEIKNLNSLKSIKRAIEYEINRQTQILDSGKQVKQETRRFSEKSGETLTLRTKEESDDYRYFPEPDLLPIYISDEEIEEIKKSLCELPNKRFSRLVNEYNLTPADAKLIIANRDFSDFYDATAKINPSYKTISKLMLSELNRCFNESNKTVKDLKFTPYDLSELVKMYDNETVSKQAAKSILRLMFETGENPLQTAKKNRFIMKTNTKELECIIDKVLSENEKSISDYNNGNKKAFSYLMGQAMRISGEGTNPVTLKSILENKLNNITTF